MLLDVNWRTSVQNYLLERAQEDSMKMPVKVKELVDTQFNEFSEPIKELTEIIQGDGFYRYKAYDRAMDVEYSDNKIVFSRVMFSAEGKETDKENFIELNHDGRVFVHSIEGRQDEYINKAKIENIIKKCFELGIALRK